MIGRNGRKVLVAGAANPLSVQATILNLKRQRDALARELHEVKQSWQECRTALNNLLDAMEATRAAEAKVAALHRQQATERGNPYTLH
jgi:hypothetical protein